MTHKKNYREMMEALLKKQEKEGRVATVDAQEILRRLGFKDETKQLERVKQHRRESEHNHDSAFTHPKLADFRLQISKGATLSWENESALVVAVEKLQAVQPGVLERLEPGYVTRVANSPGEQTFRQ